VLSHTLAFVPEDESFFASLPARAAVFLLRGENSSEPYISKTANLRRRLQRLLGPQSEHSKRLNLRNQVRSIEYTPTGSDFESTFLLYRLVRSIFPKTYSSRLKFRFPALIRMHLQNPYPRASITTRLGRLDGKSHYYGPFRSRTVAEKFANSSLDFFKMRRCVDDLHPDPQFPGCIYSEMKMCLAPCFKGCTDEQYEEEVSRVQSYFETSGDSLLREISAQRDQASANLEFENAAALHAKLEKIKPVIAQLPEIVHRIDQLRALLIQPGAEAGTVCFYQIDAGVIRGPIAFSIEPAEHTKSQSMEARIEQALTTVAESQPHGAPENAARETSPQVSALETMEHLAILSRWYYRSRRVGEIFFADSKGVLPLRRIVRGLSRVYNGVNAPTEDAPQEILPSQ